MLVFIVKDVIFNFFHEHSPLTRNGHPARWMAAFLLVPRGSVGWDHLKVELPVSKGQQNCREEKIVKSFHCLTKPKVDGGAERDS